MFIEKKTKCWKCGKEISVYTWPGHVLWDSRCPAKGRPSTLKFRSTSDVQDKYWGNYCSECGRIQGDWFLYCEPGGAFSGDRQG